MKKKVCLLVTFIVSLFIWCDVVSADAKELTCVYKSKGMNYITMLVQTNDGKQHYFAVNDILEKDLKDINKGVNWKKTSDYSDKSVDFYYNSDKLSELSSCPKYTSGYYMGKTEVIFTDEKKGDSKIELIDKLSGNTIPYVVSAVSPEQDKIDNFKWNAKCSYCDDEYGCFNLYFNDNDFLVDNSRKNIHSQTYGFKFEDIADIYFSMCPSTVYEYYTVGISDVSNSHNAQYYFVKPSGVREGLTVAGSTKTYLNRIALSNANYVDDSGSTDDDFVSVDVDNCEQLFGPRLIEIINSIMSIIRIIIPILLVVLGILDFSKATFAGKEDEMAKNRKRFINRIIAALIVFLVPMFVNLLLTLANEVWEYIVPTSCIK